jgi:hypothetical protein
LAVGALSSLRAKTIEEYLTKNLRIPSAKIVVTNKGAQGPPWDGKDAKAEKYTKNQYVKVFAKLNTAQPATTATTAQTDPKVCNQEIESSGGRGNPNNGFISEVKTIDLGETLDTFTFLLDPKNVPDLMIVEYNGKTQTTGFIGSDTELYQTLIGTVIYNYYDNWGTARPWWFKDLKLVGVQPYHADQVLKRDVGQWMPDDYSHIWPTRPQLGGNFFQNEFKKNEGFYPKKLNYGYINTVGAGVNAWDSSAAIKIQKVPGVNTAKVTIVGLLGQTKWKLYVKCGKPEALITSKGGPGGDV